MKFKVGNIVKVVNKDLDSYGQIGRIASVDTEWHVPYEVNFGHKKFEEEIFYESDLTLIDEGEDTEVVAEATPRDFIDITFQNGAVSENGVNGAQIEDVIDVLVERLEGFQKGDLACRENALAITHLQEAQNWLYRRTMRRREQGVEGKNVNHD